MDCKSPSPSDSVIGMEIRTVDISDLSEDPKNARVHGKKNLKSIKDSLDRFGQVEPLVVQKGTNRVIGGNGRLAVLKAEGAKTVDVHEVDVDDKEAAALGLALNRTGDLADWDDEKLAEIIAEHESIPGWDEKQIERILRAQEEVASAVTETDDSKPIVMIASPGQRWILGDHVLVCGDSTKKETYELLLGTETVDAVITDPPYGVSYQGGTKEKLTIANDDKEDLLGLLQSSLGLAHSFSKPGATWYVWAPSGPQFYDFATVLKALNVWRQTIVWVKDRFVLGHSDFHYQHESCLQGETAFEDVGLEEANCIYGWKEGADHKGPPTRKQSTVWLFERPSASRDHPTMKPVGLMEQCVRFGSSKGDRVLDPFCGSGTTLIACEQSERSCYAIELSDRYASHIIHRWESMTGRKAELQP